MQGNEGVLLMRDIIIEQILNDKVIAIVRGLELRKLEPLVQALNAGGISLVELTFDQKNHDSWAETCRGIEMLAEKFDGRVSVGAGTVLTKEQARLAKDAGAKYIIAPDVNAGVIGYTREAGMVSIPGCMTPTDVTTALAAGADFIKLFPADVLGAAYVKAICAPLSHARMLAVGGMNEKNAAEFIKAGCVGIGVGGNLVNRKWIEAGAFDQIEAIARSQVEAVGR